jgi:hypothetical protein
VVMLRQRWIGQETSAALSFAESKSDSLELFGQFGVLTTSRGLNRFHGQKNTPSVDS